MITEEELERQRKVVQNERRQSYENRPYARAELAIPEAMYPADHPYHWPTIGSHADLEAATVADVRAFFERFYRPSNASLVIGGDFDPAEARDLVERFFGWQPQACRRRPRAPGRPAALARDIELSLTDKVQLPRLRLSWHSPALFAAGDADLDMAAHVLGGGKSSRLYKALVFEQRIAQDVFAYQGSQMLSSLFHIGATAKPGYDLDVIARAVQTRRSTASPRTGRRTPSWRARATRTWPTSTRASTTCRRAPTCSTTTSTCWAIRTASAATSPATSRRPRESVRDAFARVGRRTAAGPARAAGSAGDGLTRNARPR